MKITSKPQGIALWTAGAFGNKLRTWPTLEACLASGYRGRVGLRYIDPRGGGTPWEAHVPIDELALRMLARRVCGLRDDLTLFCEEAPDHRLILNGEFSDLYGFYCSNIKKPMRAALKEGGRWVSVAAGRLMLKHCMTPSSWSDFEALLEVYPEYVIELSVYDIPLGELRGRNALIWEVRQY